MAFNCELGREGTLADTGDVRFWHLADMLNALTNVCFRGQSGQRLTAGYLGFARPCAEPHSPFTAQR
jgi:hypothetical protein